MSFLSALLGNYGDDMARAFTNKMDDAVLSGIRNKADDVARSAIANKTDDMARATVANYGDDFAKLTASKRATTPINQRLTGDSLLDGDEIVPLYRGQKYGTNDLLYNKMGGGIEGAGKSVSVGNAYYFTPNKAMTEPWVADGLNPIEIGARKSDIMTLDELLKQSDEAERIFADPRRAEQLYKTNPTQYELFEALADRRYRDISELTGKPFIQPDSGQGQELSETLFFPDTNPTLTNIYRELLKIMGGK